MGYLRLFERFIARSLLQEKARSAVVLVGIAAGVAVVTAIQLANSAVLSTFRAAVESVGGNASLRIRGAAGRFDERRFPELAWIESYGRISPVVQAFATVWPELPPGPAGGSPPAEQVYVLGVDMLQDSPIRDYQVLATAAGRPPSPRELLDLLRDPDAIILTEKFLRRHGQRVGGTIRLAFGSQSRDFTIRAVLLDRGPARTMDGNFALMDIAAAQLAADRLGTLDHVDVALRPGLDAERLLPEIQQRLPAGLVAEFPDAAASRADTMIAAFHFNLQALGGVALVVGFFLVYSAIAVSVAARRNEIGLLQAAGAGRRTVLLLFLGEAIALGLAGAALGLPLGRLLAASAVQATSLTVETFYIAGVAQSSAAGLRIGAADILLGLLVALPLALLAAAIPAWEAATVHPLAALRGNGDERTRARVLRSLLISLACLVAGGGLSLLRPAGGLPWAGLLAGLFFLLAGALAAPACLALACGIVRSLASRVLPGVRTELRLSAANLQSALPRISISVAALAVSLSMMVALAIMVSSFRQTVIYWLESILSAELAVRPVVQSSTVSEARLSPRVLAVIRRDPDVRETVWFSSRQLPLEGAGIRLAITELAKTVATGRLKFKSPRPDPARLAASVPPPVFVSESYALRNGKSVGQTIELPGSNGLVTLRIEAIYYDYASNQGTVMMDQEVYRQFYGADDPQLAPQHIGIYLRPGADPQSVRRRILESLGPEEQVYCATQGEVRDAALRIFESTFTITYALQLIALVIAGLGVASTLIALIHQRQREIGLLSLLGATGRQIRRVILTEAIVLGGVSQGIGIVTGILLAALLVFVINVQSFGWTIQFRLPYPFLIRSTVSVLIASWACAFYPAVRASNLNPLQTVRRE